MFAWWCWTPEHLQRDRERDDWPEQRGRTQDETAAGGSRGGGRMRDETRQGARVVVAGRETRRRRQEARMVVSPEVAERRGDNDDGSATVAMAAREAVAVAARSSRCWSGRNL
ncbi:hypothetical protein DEO72_LG2g3560 [Vigna unguiculata]|uniref:Uncharacterized protein n=1 Tax=Vigna unguiculata TaxID=3917 RepID=A0A4D6L3X1_VIGUN|nr:hypothetical protein DEO72_LG2g3560 [Vigna unguiculata]